MYRKGQNLRCFINGAVVMSETNLTVTRGVDTEDASNKDLAPDSTAEGVGGQIPVPVYKNMTFQVEAQGAGGKDLFEKCLALMNSTGGVIAFAPTNGTNNRTGTPSTAYQAICNDLTINAPNRQPITCTAQFTVIGTTTYSAGTAPAVETTPVKRGEFLRLFIGTSTATDPIALATSCSLHVSLSLEDATTKDTTSTSALGYKSQEATMLSYDISSDTLYGGNSGAQDINGLVEGTKYKWALCDASGDHQWTQGSALVSGEAILTSLGTNAATGQNITHNGSFTGVGLFDGAESSSEL